MRIVVLANNKGGVGKTTTAFNLAAGLREKKKKVLLIDLDAQENLAFTCGISDDDLDGISLFDVFHKKANIGGCIFQIYDDIADFDIIVGGMESRNADTDKKFVEGCLKEALQKLPKDYDYVVIDTPPSMNMITAEALRAADDLIIPIEPSPFSYNGVANLLGFIKQTNPKIKNPGLLLVGMNERTKLAQGFLSLYQDIKGTKLYKTTIHSSVAIPESQLNRKPIFKHAPNSTVAKDYKAFVDEYMKGTK